MIKIFFICLVFILFDCSKSASSNNTSTMNKEVSLESNSSVETSSGKTQNVNDSSVENKNAVERVQNTLSECAKNRISYLPKGANIIQSLCFDPRKPVDKTEIVKNPKINSAYNAENSEVVAKDISFEKLPQEVQKVVKQTSPEIDTDAVYFNLMLNVVDDEFYKSPKKMVLVKSYIFTSYSREDKPGKDVNYHSWTFLRQNGQLKLHSATIVFP